MDATTLTYGPGKIWMKFKKRIYQHNLGIDDWVISCEIALEYFSLDLTDDKSELAQVMTRCR